jgi:DNA-binding CsgD family transcriptional regulator
MRPDLKRAVALVRKGASYGEAAKKFGLTRNMVAGACTRASVRKGRLEAERARAKEAVRLYATGMPLKLIAKQLGYASYACVCRSVRAAGAPRTRYRIGSSSVVPKAAQLYAKGVSTTEIARQCGWKNSGALYSALHRRGIPLRQPRP